MRLLKKLSHPDGAIEVKVSIGTSEDLWHLYNLILPGDSVRTKTRRKVTKENSMGSQKAEIKVLTLEVVVGQVDFTPDEVRVQGTNVTENSYVKLGAHHTLTVNAVPPQDVTVLKKEWDEIAEGRLREACNQDDKADTAAVLMNTGEAQVMLVTSSFVHTKARVDVTIAKKHRNNGSWRDKSIHKFFKQVLDAVIKHVDMEKVKVLLLCSPGTVREEFLRYVKETTQKVEQGPMRTLFLNLPKLVLVKVSSNTVGSLREAFCDPAVTLRMENTRCSADIRVWEAFQGMMNNDPDRCVYTPQFVYHAAQIGSISSLMISDAVFRSPDPVERRFFLSLYHFVKRSGASVNVFSSNHVTGEQLMQLGSVAAVLLFACPELDAMEVYPEFMMSEEVATFIRENPSSNVTV